MERPILFAKAEQIAKNVRTAIYTNHDLIVTIIEVEDKYGKQAK